MTYAKLINNYPSFAPNPIKVGDSYIGNPPGSVYEEHGYKPVVFADDPGEAPEGYVWAETWAENENIILQGWALAEEGDVDPAEAMDILFGGEG